MGVCRVGMCVPVCARGDMLKGVLRGRSIRRRRCHFCLAFLIKLNSPAKRVSERARVYFLPTNNNMLNKFIANRHAAQLLLLLPESQGAMGWAPKTKVEKVISHEFFSLSQFMSALLLRELHIYTKSPDHHTLWRACTYVDSQVDYYYYFYYCRGTYGLICS